MTWQTTPFHTQEVSNLSTQSGSPHWRSVTRHRSLCLALLQLPNLCANISGKVLPEEDYFFDARKISFRKIACQRWTYCPSEHRVWQPATSSWTVSSEVLLVLTHSKVCLKGMFPSELYVKVFVYDTIPVDTNQQIKRKQIQGLEDQQPRKIK